MTTSASTSTPSLADTLTVVDAVLGALHRRIPSHVSRDDLASAGKVALIEAFQRYEGPAEKLRAYCFVRVRGAMFDELRRLDPLSRHTRTQIVLVRRAATELERVLQRPPEPGELAKATGFSPAAILQLERLVTATHTASTDDVSLADEIARATVEDETACPARSAEADDARASVRAALDRLAPNHAHVLRRYYLDDATLDDIANELRVSKERVRQIREAAEKKLRADFVVLALWQTLVSRG